MALSKSTVDNENKKFKEGSGGEVLVQVTGVSTDPLPITGNFTVAAPGPILVSGATVTSTSAAFPSTNQTNRATLSVRNLDASQSIWVVNSSGITKATAGTAIWEIGPDETFNVDFNDTNQLFLVADSGQNVDIQILEIKGP